MSRFCHPETKKVGRTDRRTDAEGYNIIRLFFKQAYKNLHLKVIKNFSQVIDFNRNYITCIYLHLHVFINALKKVKAVFQASLDQKLIYLCFV